MELARKKKEKEKQDGEDVDDENHENVDEGSITKAICSIRQLALRRLADFFRIPVAFEHSCYLQASFHAIVSPRLSFLDKENTQAPSALLDMFYVCAS